MTKKSNAGRPTVMTKEVLAKLKEHYLLDGTDEEACLYAGISMRALYSYQEKNEEFKQEKALWKQNPFVIARTSVVEGLEKDPKIALDYLRNKKNKEFSTQQQIDHTSGGEKIIPIMGGLANDTVE